MDERMIRKKELYDQLIVAGNKVTNAMQTLSSLKNTYNKLKHEYEVLDYELALEHKQVITTEKKQAQLTIEQLHDIASRLGIKIEED